MTNPQEKDLYLAKHGFGYKIKLTEKRNNEAKTLEGDVYDSFAYNPKQRACFMLRARKASGCLYVSVDEELIFIWKGNGHVKFKEYVS